MIHVAFCSESGKVVDSHFARSQVFYIYAVDAGGYEQVRKIAFFDLIELKNENAEDEQGEDDRVERRLRALRDCSIVYCTHIGGPAAARLVQNKIHPLKVPAGTPIQEEVEKLGKILGTNPPPWLKKRYMKYAESSNDR